MNECIFDIDPKLLSLASEAENECREMFEKIDSNAEYNGQKVLKAFIDNRVSEGCLKLEVSGLCACKMLAVSKISYNLKIPR